MQQQLITNKKIEMLLEELKEVKVRLDKFLAFMPEESIKEYKNAKEIKRDYLEAIRAYPLDFFATKCK